MSKELKTGIIITIIIVGFVWAFNFMKGQDLFQPNNRYYKVEYKNVGGLTEASLVTINGFKVGKVEDIDFNDDPKKRGELIVKFSVDNDFEFSRNSIVKIYSPSPISGSNLAIIPNYDGDLAVTGDLLKGEIESTLFTSIGEKLDPIQAKLERVLVSADTLFQRVNHVLDQKTTNSIQKSVKGIEHTIAEFKQTLISVNSILDSSSEDLELSLKNTKKITDNLAKVSDTLSNVNISQIVRNTEGILTSVNSLLDGIDKGKGSLGKLVNDDTMYNNLTNMSKELEELLREMKLNPKRFVHFSLFGKKAKAYDPEKNINNETNE
ncbi:MlaD family protein [uncultured Polaribacter sp.]|uniref:MlaD family protein n=1 Tax=uncultured Polaribacter sp. TaxID=174711 RepID=UPI002613845F|nr:MlaD family protein [uncultured Polaribacter sp.]